MELFCRRSSRLPRREGSTPLTLGGATGEVDLWVARISSALSRVARAGLGLGEAFAPTKTRGGRLPSAASGVGVIVVVPAVGTALITDAGFPIAREVSRRRSAMSALLGAIVLIRTFLSIALQV